MWAEIHPSLVGLHNDKLIFDGEGHSWALVVEIQIHCF